MRNIKKQGYTNFKNVNGEKIRRQYFDIPIAVLFSVMFVVIVSVILEALVKEEILLDEAIKELKTEVWAVGILIISAFILKLLNLAFFGDVLCTLTSRRVHCKSGFFGYDEIVGATYHVGGPTIAYQGGVTLAVNQKNGTKTDVVIYRAPIGLLRQIKKYKSNIITDYTLFTKETMIIFGLFTLLAPIFIAFFG